MWRQSRSAPGDRASPTAGEAGSSRPRLACARMKDAGPQRVEVIVGVRTLLTLTAFGALVALAILSIGTLLSILVAAVLALGLDPVVAGLVARGHRRGRAALAVFAAGFVAVF